jgi:hypothetical protein
MLAETSRKVGDVDRHDLFNDASLSVSPSEILILFFAPLRLCVRQSVGNYQSSHNTSPPSFFCRASRSLITPRLVLMIEIPRPFKIGRSSVARL